MKLTAIPQLLEMLEIKGCIVTIDAMGTQSKTAEEIVEKGAGYILSVKENQARLYSDIVLYFEAEHKNLTETAKTLRDEHAPKGQA